MPNKITWKKGMRLTTEIFDSMDSANFETIKNVAKLASAGSYGLFPSSKPFELSVNISNDILEIITLRCFGITKNGQLIDIDFDSNYSNTCDTRLPIPTMGENEALYLVVRMHPSEWREVNERYSEALYTFELIRENTIIDDNCLPIGCIVNQYGWRLNETDFIPPCLYVSAHPKYESQLLRASNMLREAFVKCLSSQSCVAKKVLGFVWNVASMGMHTLDNERQSITPNQLYTIIQQYIGAFMIGCCLDEYISLDNPDPFIMYTQKGCDQKTLYRDIEMGLSLCEEIGIKMEMVLQMTEVKSAPMERPTPKPQPERAKTPSKNPWEGIVI